MLVEIFMYNFLACSNIFAIADLILSYASGLNMQYSMALNDGYLQFAKMAMNNLFIYFSQLVNDTLKLFR